MKFKILLIAAAALLVSTASMAQEQGDFRGNAGFTYYFAPWDGDGRIGYGLGVEYLITDAISLAPSYYLSKKDGIDLNVFNIDARYYFMTGETGVYGKLGFASYGGDASESGLSLGAGGVFGLSDSLGLNAELNYGLNKPTGADKAFGLAANVGVVMTF